MTFKRSIALDKSHKKALCAIYCGQTLKWFKDGQFRQEELGICLEEIPLSNSFTITDLIW